jgi:hypothetical protein
MGGPSNRMIDTTRSSSSSQECLCGRILPWFAIKKHLIDNPGHEIKRD